SEMIEVPVVAEGALDPALVETLAPVADFFGIGMEIWQEEDAAAALRRLLAPSG
ncbi:MAG: thiamine phosphate synthase, partial [Gemmobacter sp.]